MPDFADETAYYFDKNSAAVALIANGVRFPAGTWVRVANAGVPPDQVERMLGKVFPQLQGKALSFVTLSNEQEVEEFERLMAAGPRKG